jgi:3-mercaptopyruvate sulfurtransferase SseA
VSKAFEQTLKDDTATPHDLVVSQDNARSQDQKYEDYHIERSQYIDNEFLLHPSETFVENLS